MQTVEWERGFISGEGSGGRTAGVATGDQSGPHIIVEARIVQQSIRENCRVVLCCKPAGSLVGSAMFACPACPEQIPSIFTYLNSKESSDPVGRGRPPDMPEQYNALRRCTRLSNLFTASGLSNNVRKFMWQGQELNYLHYLFIILPKHCRIYMLHIVKEYNALLL